MAATSTPETDETTAPKRSQIGIYSRGKHGLKLRDERVRRLVRKMREAMPWLEDADVPMMRAWAELETLAVRAHAELRDRKSLVGVGTEGVVRLVDDYRKLRAAQLLYSRELAMSPASRAIVKVAGKSQPYDLVAQLAAANAEEAAGEIEAPSELTDRDGQKPPTAPKNRGTRKAKVESSDDSTA
jgi:hypothetical protein